jgi:uncharacterized protein YbjQ (UPF0145 family)
VQWQSILVEAATIFNKLININQLFLLRPHLLSWDKTPDMITTTTPNIEGHPIQQYFGVVSAEVIIGANFLKDILGGLRDILGGRSGTYERVLEEARQNALNELVGKAQRMGANAVVGIDLDFETIGANSSMLMVVASGTAVRVA